MIVDTSSQRYKVRTWNFVVGNLSPNRLHRRTRNLFAIAGVLVLFKIGKSFQTNMQLVFRLRWSDHISITDAMVSLHWLRVPERIIFNIAVQTYRALHGDAPQYGTYGSSHRSPTSRLNKDCGLLHPTIYSFLLSDCLLLDVAPSLSQALAHRTTYLPMSP